MSEWRTIKTIPRDRTKVLLFECGDYYAGAFLEDDGDGGMTFSSSCGQYVCEPPKPTHWMPLPAPPREGDGDD